MATFSAFEVADEPPCMRANVIGRRHSTGHGRILDPFGAAKVVGSNPNEGIQGHGTPLFRVLPPLEATMR